MIPLRADILVNGNFADGRAHWKGDAKDIDTNNTSAGTQPGVTITLNKDKWTKIYQTFNTHAKNVRYSITFTLSPDYQVQQDSYNAGSGTMSGPTPGLDDIEGMPYLYGYSYNGGWMLIVREFGGWGSGSLYPRPDPKKTDSQTLTGEIRGLTENAGKIILLAFPRGEGTITLTNISLTAEDQ
jgi:hypothetical protein